MKISNSNHEQTPYFSLSVIMAGLRMLIENIVVFVILKIAHLIWSNPETKISEIIYYGFRYFQYFILRINYTWEEYQLHRIPRTYRRLRQAILMSFNAWLVIIFLVIYIYSEDSSIWISIYWPQQSLFYFVLVINYKSPIQSMAYKTLLFDEKRLAANYHRHLIIYHLFIKIAAYIFAACIGIGVIIVCVMGIYFLTKAYFYNQITSVQLLFCLMIFFPICFEVCSLFVLLLVGAIAAGFILEFLKIRMKQLYIFLKHDESSKNIPKMKFFWNCIQKEYVELYSEVALLDKTISFAMYSLETGSKILSITSCIFYSRQMEMTPSNTLAMLGMILAYFYIIAIFSRLTFSPKYNHQYCRLILNRMAKRAIVKHNDRKRKIIIKSNLFIQTISDNHFGFHCGQIFFITKFKVVQLFLMNLPLITLTQIVNKRPCDQ
ncbi:hypothetical protein DERF_011877 [Dermatophagoides farinae]|uniref:Uncharacterized protein n=1 Tax=Dermatophagoides farinae TaxID=6954 RepID=A0A922KWE0_DERFA|nr:hypothetical protein DERF_011877 [Dermatophagoides farinae]